jgi:histidinol dehydrogenase
MNVLRYTDKAYDSRIRELTAQSSLFDPDIEQRTRTILQDVHTRGDDALVELTQRFDQANVQPEQFAVSQAELFGAAVQADDSLRSAVRIARRNIERFSRRALRRNWSTRNAQGAAVGEKYDPFQRVGIYVPGGTAPLVSTALMTVTLAVVAGCPEIVVCTPCRPDGSINPALLYAIRVAGATEVYRLGGAQAIAAMGFGSPSIRPVQKIFGPGNAYVVAAKRLLFGRVSIDLLPGPSEVLVLADDSARPEWVAADLLAQAEHGSGHERVWLVTTSAKLLRSVPREIERQLPQLSRRDMISAALANHGWLIHVRDLDQALALVNQIALNIAKS